MDTQLISGRLFWQHTLWGERAIGPVHGPWPSRPPPPPPPPPPEEHTDLVRRTDGALREVAQLHRPEWVGSLGHICYGCYDTIWPCSTVEILLRAAEMGEL